MLGSKSAVWFWVVVLFLAIPIAYSSYIQGPSGSSGSSAWIYNVWCPATLAGSETGYCGAYGLTTVEAGAKVRVPKAGTLKNLVVINTTYSNPTLACTARVNAVDTAITVSIPSDTVAGTVFTDLSNTATVAVGDILNLKCVNGATFTSTSISWQITVE